MGAFGLGRMSMGTGTGMGSGSETHMGETTSSRMYHTWTATLILSALGEWLLSGLLLACRGVSEMRREERKASVYACLRGDRGSLRPPSCSPSQQG